MWRQINTCTCSTIDFDAISHAGLRTDGQFALVFSPAGQGIVWDFRESRIRRSLPDDLPVLDQFISREGFLHINYGFGHGKYRVFGKVHAFPLVEHQGIGLGIAVDLPLSMVTLYSINTESPQFALPSESFTGDWAVGSFSDDGSVVAVAWESAVSFYAAGDTPIGCTTDD